MERCVVCESEIKVIRLSNGNLDQELNCPRCGHYKIRRSVLAVFSDPDQDHRMSRAILSHQLRRMQETDEVPFIDRLDAEAILATQRLPEPRKQADNLVEWLGNTSRRSFQPKVPVELLTAAGAMGALNEEFAALVVDFLVRDAKFLELKSGIGSSKSPKEYQLTLLGWDRYFELQSKRETDTKLAFMAMPSGKAEVDTALEKCFKTACDGAGFELGPVWERGKAGLIDDHIQVEIRRARFMIAELTGLNKNVLWEAGFATGLGMHVFYTCGAGFKKRVEEKQVKFDGEDVKWPFDVRNRNTVFWTSDKLDNATRELKAMIRNTFPTEATMRDDDLP